MHNTTEACAAVDVPPGIFAEVDGYEWTRSQTGRSGAAVYGLQGKPNAPDLFLKHGEGAVASDVVEEMVKLQWLATRIPVPAVRHFVSTPGEAWLLMTALPGETAYDVLRARAADRFAIVDAIAQFLRRLHSIPVSECPFNSAHNYRLALGRERIDAGLVDESDFDDERKGWTAEKVWEGMHSLLPFTPDHVVTHGDLSLDNLLLADCEVVGCIDVGRVGIADRYQDLAIAWNGLEEFGEPLRNRLFAQYGIAKADESKLQFHLLLDELF